MKQTLIIGSMAAAALLAAGCSSSGGGYNNPAGGNSSSSSSSSSSSPATGGNAVTISLQSGHLVSSDGRALYTNSVDTATKFGCNGGCLTEWPPVVGAVTVGSGVDKEDFGVAKRADGTMQVTYYGKPIYEFAEDKSASDTKGSGLSEDGITWALAKPDNAPATSLSSSATSSSTSGGGGYGY